MRLLFLADRLSGRGGADLHLLAVLERLAAGHEVRLAAGRDDATARAPCPVHIVPGLQAAGRQPVAEALDRLVAALAPDTVHAHNLMNPDALEWAANAGAVATVQDHRAFCPGRGKLTAGGLPCATAMSAEACAACFADPGYFDSIRRLTEERLEALRRMRAIVVLSRYVAGELVAAGVQAERVHVIPPFVHGLDTRALPSGGEGVLFAGRLVAAKGFADAVEAWRRSRVGLPLLVAGAGPERGRVRVPGLEHLGWVEHAAMAGVYARARALLFPPRWQEPFGIAGLEALAFGVPVVAWESGGVAEWHPGPLAHWGDVDALAGLLAEAIGRRAEPRPGFDAGAALAALVRLHAGG